jgi:hypothetical protein
MNQEKQDKLWKYNKVMKEVYEHGSFLIPAAIYYSKYRQGKLNNADEAIGQAYGMFNKFRVYKDLLKSVDDDYTRERIEGHRAKHMIKSAGKKIFYGHMKNVIASKVSAKSEASMKKYFIEKHNPNFATFVTPHFVGVGAYALTAKGIDKANHKIGAKLRQRRERKNVKR